MFFLLISNEFVEFSEWLFSEFFHDFEILVFEIFCPTFLIIRKVS